MTKPILEMTAIEAANRLHEISNGPLPDTNDHRFWDELWLLVGFVSGGLVAAEKRVADLESRVRYERAQRMQLQARLEELDPPQEVHGT
jgi:hypothetical protein